MPYSQFTLSQVKQDFQLTTVSPVRFFPAEIEQIAPSSKLQAILEDLPWAIAVDTEKARSEAIINPVLLEVRRILNLKVSVFSGEEFNVDPQLGLNGVCDFLISCSPEQLTVEAPAIVVVHHGAKKYSQPREFWGRSFFPKISHLNSRSFDNGRSYQKQGWLYFSS